ncbi:MAG TPA: sigma-54 dependent transcriptional regulator [Myxococcota bacterium]|nr:sigma-54 dependent transcriptional regulator [Myxococcota bacterium]
MQALGAAQSVSRRAQRIDRPARLAFHGGVSEAWVGAGAAMAALEEGIRAAAARDASLLVTGETGVGKGHVARRVHALGPRRARPFVHVDCTALSPTLVESELFGHERGAFTDAAARRVGRLERAGAGTLFLDEIGDLPLELQAKLLRVLQDREFERVGGAETLVLRARVVAATHRDLAARVAAGRFREDLYYRLDVLRLAVPPLRERLEDLPALAAAALERAGAAGRVRFDAHALARLCAHPWFGNVRELGNVVERCVARVARGTIGADIVERALARPLVVRREAAAPVVAVGSPFAPGAAVGPPPTPGADRAAAADRASAERAAIEAALVATGGNVRRAARQLGLARSTLRYRIGRLRLEHLLPGRRASHETAGPCRLVAPREGASGPAPARGEREGPSAMGGTR